MSELSPIKRARSLIPLTAALSVVAPLTACKPDDRKAGEPNTTVAETRSRLDSTSPPPNEPGPSTQIRRSSIKTDVRRVASASGAFVVCYRIDAPSDSIPLNEMFAMQVWVEDADGQALGQNEIDLRVDAGMPQHGHGMNTTPKTEPADDGFQVSGMLFHMPGDWKVYFDVTRDGATDRATVDVTLD